MALGADSVASLASLIQPLFLGKKTNTTRSIDPAVSAQFNQIFQALSPQLTGQVVSDDELNNLVQSTLAKSAQAFAPQKTQQRAAGAYNSTSQQLLQNDAMAKATQEAVATLINAKLQSAQQQTQAAQIAANATAQQGQLTGATMEQTPAALGGLAMPLALYAGYKMLTAGKATGSDAGQVSSLVIKSPEATADFLAGKGSAYTGGASAGGIDVAGNVDKLLAEGIGTGTGITGAAQPLGALDTMLAKSTTGLPDFGSLMDIPSADIAAPAIGSMTGLEAAAPAADAIAGTAESAGNLGGMFEGDMLGNITSGAMDIISQVPVVGEPIAGALGSAGEAMSGLNKALTIDTPIGGVPMLAGLPNLLQGDVGGAAKEIGITMALNAIPGVGPVLNVVRAISKMCYITTAVTEATGKGDDAYELEVLRKYRDEFMLATPVGQELVQNYYDVAPKVVEKLSKREDAKEIYTRLYTTYLQPAVVAVEKGDNYEALRIYREMSQAAEAIANLQD